MIGCQFTLKCNVNVGLTNMFKRVMGIVFLASSLIACSEVAPDDPAPSVPQSAPSPSPVLRGTPAEGKRVADKWCINCHLTSSERVDGSDAAPTWVSIASDPNKTDTYIRSFLTNTHGEMQGISLSRQQISDVIAYIRTLE